MIEQILPRRIFSFEVQTKNYRRTLILSSLKSWKMSVKHFKIKICIRYRIYRPPTANLNGQCWIPSTLLKTFMALANTFMGKPITDEIADSQTLMIRPLRSQALRVALNCPFPGLLQRRTENVLRRTKNVYVDGFFEKSMQERSK